MNESFGNSKFRIRTHWIVFTGAPSAGKTTILRKLNEHGYLTVPEVARTHIEEETSKGLSIEQIRRDESQFQKELLSKKIDIENKLTINDTVILDRGVPDSVTYFRLAGLDPESAIPKSYEYRYRLVFVFDRLPYLKDVARTESEEQAEYIDKWIRKDYQNLGYNLIIVPVMSSEKRIEFILDKVNKLND